MLCFLLLWVHIYFWWPRLDFIDPYHAVAILDLKRGWTGMKIAKMANDPCCVPRFNNNTCYHSGKDLSYFNFPRDKQKRKLTPSLECIVYVIRVRYLCPSSLISNPKWVLSDKGLLALVEPVSLFLSVHLHL